MTRYRYIAIDVDTDVDRWIDRQTHRQIDR